jgi:hypothetical protein
VVLLFNRRHDQTQSGASELCSRSSKFSLGCGIATALFTFG